ncbi:MAG TPA: hypothetical protein VLL54_21010 [Pyrinomonadaceae bacterium]|nr:hypothetical protein [Pyrinomonadaceae bacterium]
MRLESITYALLFLMIPAIDMEANYSRDLAFLVSTPGDVRFSGQGKLNVWRGLVPLRSTRHDVERVLGDSKSSSPPDYVYDTKNENIIVRYSTDTCSRAPNVEWDVPINTVVSITVSPKADLLIRDLHLDLQEYGRSELAHPQGLIRYVSAEDGVQIESKLQDGCEVVMSITYTPTTKDNRMRCGFKNTEE